MHKEIMLDAYEGYEKDYYPKKAVDFDSKCIGFLAKRNMLLEFNFAVFALPIKFYTRFFPHFCMHYWICLWRQTLYGHCLQQ